MSAGAMNTTLKHIRAHIQIYKYYLHWACFGYLSLFFMVFRMPINIAATIQNPNEETKQNKTKHGKKETNTQVQQQ